MGGDDADDSGDVDVDGEVMLMIMAMASLVARALSRGFRESAIGTLRLQSNFTGYPSGHSK